MGAAGACVVPQLRQALVKTDTAMALCAKGQLRVCTSFWRAAPQPTGSSNDLAWPAVVGGSVPWNGGKRRRMPSNPCAGARRGTETGPSTIPPALDWKGPLCGSGTESTRPYGQSRWRLAMVPNAAALPRLLLLPASGSRRANPTAFVPPGQRRTTMTRRRRRANVSRPLLVVFEVLRRSSG